MMMQAWQKTRWARYAALAVLCAGPVVADELAGTLAWEDRIGMGTLVSGVVDKVAVRPGQAVARGDLLLSLDRRGFRAEVAGARAEAARAEALLEEAVREDERAGELYERTLLSERERTQATIALRDAEAAAQRAKAGLVRAQLDFEHSELRAPFAGRVLAVHASPGQAVVSDLRSDPLVELAADEYMLVQGEADLATARAIRDGRVTIEVSGQSMAAETVQIGFEPVQAGSATPRYQVVARFLRPQSLELRAGEPARLTW